MSGEDHSFIEHWETFLGQIQAGARLTQGIHGVWFRDQPVPGASTFATLGLNQHLLAQEQGTNVRVEFLLACRDEFVAPFNPMSLLADVSEQTLSLHRAPPRGTVIGPGGRFFGESAMEALYCSPPVCFGEGLAHFSGFAEPFIPIWLVPITPLEARYAQTHGWARFEDQLQRSRVDPLDLLRPTLFEHA